MDVCEVDKSLVKGLLEMPFSLRSVARKLKMKRTNEPALFTKCEVYWRRLQEREILLQMSDRGQIRISLSLSISLFYNGCV